ncbi:hypothetical protein JHW43_000172 [Diplocarpon mali]|nr:hypothetical protein JHW43_000172 [Diplocarpon mali]
MSLLPRIQLHVSNTQMPPRIRTVEGSCWACKERRVICDLQSPSCAKCIKAGRHCDYGKVKLRWTDGVASRGLLAGKKIPLPMYNPPVMVKSNEHHMLYFEYELLPRFTISNNVMRIDLSELSKDPILLQSVVAVANAHATYRSVNAKALSLSKIEDRNNALGLFRKHLMGSHSDEASHSLFIANVLLCILDGIIEPVTESSATHYHLLGGQAILQQWKGVGDIMQTKSDLPVLMLSIFATMDLTHSLLIGKKAFFDAPTWYEFGNCEPWWGNVQADDDFLEIMAITSQLASLGHEVRNFRGTASQGVLISIQIALEQQAARQEAAKHTSEQAAWAAFCACYRLAACVYLYRALGALDVGHELVQQAVTRCMAVIGGEALTEKLHHCILFPVLVIGSHCLVSEQRLSIKKSLVRTATFLSFESIRSLDSFLEKRWAELDRGFKQASWFQYAVSDTWVRGSRRSRATLHATISTQAHGYCIIPVETKTRCWSCRPGATLQDLCSTDRGHYGHWKVENNRSAEPVFLDPIQQEYAIIVFIQSDQTRGDVTIQLGLINDLFWLRGGCLGPNHPRCLPLNPLIDKGAARLAYRRHADCTSHMVFAGTSSVESNYLEALR